MTPPPLTALLAFEARSPGRGPRKDALIRAELGLSPARYYQLLHRVLRTREALSEDPMLVNRLLRVRDRRAPMSGEHDRERV